MACERGLAGIVRGLIGAGAIPLLNSQAGTLLSCAARYGHTEAMKVLLEPSDVRKSIKCLNDTLYEGARSSCNEAVECLLNAGANPFTLDKGLRSRLRPSTVTIFKRRLEETIVLRLLHRARRVADVMHIVKVAPARTIEWLQRRGEAMPAVEIMEGDTCLTDTLAFLLGVGANHARLPQELFLEIMDMLLHERVSEVMTAMGEGGGGERGEASKNAQTHTHMSSPNPNPPPNPSTSVSAHLWATLRTNQSNPHTPHST